MGCFTSNPTSPWRGYPKSVGSDRHSCPSNFPGSGSPQPPFLSLWDPPKLSPPQIHLLNWLLHPKIHLPMDGALKIQVGTSSHRCVQRVYGGKSLPRSRVSLPVLGAVSLATAWVGFWGAVTSQGLSGKLTPVISVGRSRPNSRYFHTHTPALLASRHPKPPPAPKLPPQPPETLPSQTQHILSRCCLFNWGEMWSDPRSWGAPRKGEWGGLGCGLVCRSLVGLWGVFWPFRGCSGFGKPRGWGGRDGGWGKDRYRDTLGYSPPVSHPQESGEGVMLHLGGPTRSNPPNCNGFPSKTWDPPP